MQMRDVPDLKELEYQPRSFRNLFEPKLGQEIWSFMQRPENVIRMETATFLEHAAVEPLAPDLLMEFGPDVREDRIKQMIGDMARQIMEVIGYEKIEEPRPRITGENIFSSAARYRRKRGGEGVSDQ